MKERCIYVIDIDGILCEETKPYKDCFPKMDVIKKVNFLYNKGCRIILFTSRRECDKEITKIWLKKKKIKYHKLIMSKPRATFYVDDKNINLGEFMNG